MNDFSHLGFQSLGLQSLRPVICRSPEQRRVLALSGDNFLPEEQQPKPKHSNAHQIAVSQPAKNNPILALKLIDRGESSEIAIETLGASYRHLSNFTKHKMIAICSGWEFMDTEDRNLEAFTYSTTHQDSNGYRAGFNAALKALEKYVEPLMPEDIRTHIQPSGVTGAAIGQAIHA